uniref:Uncharacterized protein n=1 Tax=Arundo donax TaxID=35708 RepID=A0A0A8Z0J5_ARUDO
MATANQAIMVGSRSARQAPLAPATSARSG